MMLPICICTRCWYMLRLLKVLASLDREEDVHETL